MITELSTFTKYAFSSLKTQNEHSGEQNNHYFSRDFLHKTNAISENFPAFGGIFDQNIKNTIYPETKKSYKHNK